MLDAPDEEAVMNGPPNGTARCVRVGRAILVRTDGIFQNKNDTVVQKSILWV
jgi:hypothetical protein